MILVTGATGCVGRVVVDRLTTSGQAVKCLWHWGAEHPVPRRVHLCGGDVRNTNTLAEALEEVDTVIHLASIRRETQSDTYDDVIVGGMRNLIESMQRAKVPRLITVSCLGAETRSPFPHLRAMGKADELARASGLNFTVLKSAAVFGEADWLTAWLNGMVTGLRFVVLLPHGGSTRLQPLWVGDLAACVERCLRTRSTFRQVVPIGGPHIMTLSDIADAVMKSVARQRRKVNLPSAMTRQAARFLGRLNGALTAAEMEALSHNRTTEVGSVHRFFGFAPARMAAKLNYLTPDDEPPLLPVRYAYHYPQSQLPQLPPPR